MCVGTATVLSIIFNHSFLQCYAYAINKKNLLILKKEQLLFANYDYYYYCTGRIHDKGFIHCYRLAIRFAS